MKSPPPPPSPRAKKPPKPASPIGYDPFARMLAQHVRDGHGVGQAATFDMAEELGQPRGYVGTYNIALERAIGQPGIPQGRITEISGWEGAGKSTMLDQIFAMCQAEGGIGVLADTERARFRQHMVQLGVVPESLVWIGGSTCEAMFDEVETLARTSAHYNATAWYEALLRAGVKCKKPATIKHTVWGDKGSRGKRSKLHEFTFNKWGREQSAALLEFQMAHGLPQSSIRDRLSREALRPMIAYGESDTERDEALAAWLAGDPHPRAQPADRSIVIGWDSVAGTATEAEMEGSARDVHPATAARVIRRNLRRLIQLIDDEAIAFVLVNQRYKRIPMGNQRATGSETYGGGGIKYHSTVRIEVDKVGTIFSRSTDKDNGIPPIGQVVRIKVPKNKVESPFHVEEFGLIFGRGCDNAYAIYYDLKARGIIGAGGSWSRFTDSSILGAEDRSFRGWQELSNMLAADFKLWHKLHAIYMEARGV